ncbi:MAG: translocation/assembly module TamB domain-containing protein [Parvibaculum sp.]|uniref:translocation/assembly module TamB domain-containing protein n=1 Tax=Parvibaculum sp. TaxID=2024848 RepID=UPI0025EB16CE|nr:translocation/assembly module TamB domain-containing protein [Parvibaculum sp.]MCE9650927.1 translocation/assembly module TamB domain-containing protein [Parvibaculum sp.]
MAGPTQSQLPSWKTAPGLLRTVGGVALGAVAVALTLVVAILCLLQIPALRQTALSFALARINTDETHVSIGDIGGEWPRRLVLRDFAMADARGTWLALKEADIQWSPLALLAGEAHVVRLDAKGLDIFRAPDSKPSAGDEETSFAFPTLPIAVRVDAAHMSGLSLSRAVVEPGADGLLAKLDFDGHLALTRNRAEVALKAVRVDDAAGRIDLQAAFDKRDRRIELTLDAVDGARNKPGLAALLGGLDADRVAITASAEGVGGQVSARATVDGGKTLMLDASIDGQWDSALDLDVTAKASGDFVQKTLGDLGRPRDLALAGKVLWTRDDTLSLAGLTLSTGALSLTGEAHLGTASVAAPHAFKAQGTLDGLDRLLDKPGNAALSPLTWRGAATLDLAKGTARVEDATVTARPGTAHFAGDVRLDGTAAKGGLDIALNDAAPVGQLIGQPMTGRATLSLSPFALEPDGNAAGDFVIRADAIDMGDPVLNRLFNAFTADGSLLLPKAGGFALPSLTVTPLSGDYAFKGTVSATPAGILSGEANFSTRDIAAILPDGEASGAFTAKAAFTGTLDQPAATLAAQLSDGTLGGVATRTATLDTTARLGGSGPLAFRFDGAPGKAALDAQLTLPAEGGARLDAIAADLFGSKLVGEIAIGDDALVTASLKTSNMRLKPFADMAGLPFDGTGALTLTATPANGKQNAALAFSSARLDVGLPTTVALDRVTLDAALADLFGAARVEARFAAASGQAGLTHLEGVDADAKGPLTELALSFNAKGTRETFKPDPLSLTAKAVYAGAESNLALSELGLTLGKASMELAAPVKVDLANGVAMKNFALAIAGATGTGKLGGDFALARTARLHLDAENVPVDLASLLFPVEAMQGTMNGSADLDTARNTGALSFRFERILLAQGDTNERPPFNAALKGKWAKGRFDLDAEAQGVSTRPFVLAASFPVTHPAGSAWPALAARGPVTGSLTWDGPLASLAAFVDIGNQRIGGGTHVALAARGDISAPRVSGVATVENGYYENTDSGTLLKDISARLEGSESQSLDFTLQGSDGEKGRVDAQGRISLAKGAFPAISISTSFTNAHLVHRADVDMTADGQVELMGPSFPPGPDAPLTLKGAVTTRALTIRIPERLPSSVARIEVVEINGEPSRRIVADEAPAVPVELDIKVKTGAPARVAGRGLNSFWTGELAVAGTANRPLVSGRLDSERGTLDFAGKTFTLSKGVVRFPGAYPVDPEFDVTLAYSRSDLKAAINLAGQSSAPEMTLSSTPTLPQDEILSRILFNKGVGELSALEAVQLARTLAELSGTNFGGGGLGVLDRLQETLSLDVLRIDSAQSGATTVQAGKYIQKGVYVGVEQGALASDSSVKVEIEVTPQITVDTRIGQNASGDVGVNWKWDY